MKYNIVKSVLALGSTCSKLVAITVWRYYDRVARSIAGSGGQQDFNLDGFYHILSGRRLNMPSAGLLETHIFSAPNPSISQYRINPTNGITEPVSIICVKVS